jgi:Mn-containing catalase
VKKLNVSTLSLLLVLAFSQPAAAAGWDWDSLKAAAVEATKKAEKKVDEIVSIARAKWLEWNGQSTTPVEQQRKTASDAVPVQAPIAVVAPITPATGETVNLTTQKDRVDLERLVETSKKSVANKPAVQVAQPGRAPQKDLLATKTGVPKFDLTRPVTRTGKDGQKKTVKIAIDTIPRLDVGLERIISKNDFVSSDIVVGFNPLSKAKSLPSPGFLSKAELDKARNQKIVNVTKWAGPDREKLGIGEIVTQEKVDKVNVDMNPLRTIDAEKPLAKVTENDLKMLGALQVNKKGDRCHIVSGIYHELSKDVAHEEEANFNLGICAHNMGLHSEAVKRLLKVVKSESADYTPEAIAALVEDLPREYDVQVASAIKSVNNKSLIPEKAKDHMNYILARAAHAKSNYQEAMAAAEQVSSKSSLYANARYLYAIALYGSKKNREAQKVLADLKAWMSTSGKGDRNLEALITLNTARMMFVEKRYQAAHQEYLRVPKDHPLWVPGLVEQGWAQLNVDDAPGAIGNMYSLHSPYFKSIFMPDSWIVRTIGYIDICQYGDAYKTLTKLEQLHSSHLTSVEAYTQKFKKPDDYYNTVRNYIRGKSDQGVDGLPAQIIREVARQRGFLNSQNSLNAKEDEIGQYSFIQGLITKDKAALQGKITMVKARIEKLTADLKKAESTPGLAKFINEWQGAKRNETSTLKQYEFQLSVYEQGRSGYVSMKKEANIRIESEKAKLRNEAGRELIGHLNDLKTKLSRTLESNEFLRYEIFAGSGENIRYQVAGGSTVAGQRIPANVKPQKILNWQFDGEYWEDEIGSYRSTLRNNCPKNPRAQASTTN